MVSPPFELAASQPLTRRQLLGASLGASAAIAAASLGLPAAATALETTGPRLSASQSADCLALASTVARQEGIGVSDGSPTAVVAALGDGYARAGQVHRDNVNAYLEPLELDGRRFASLSDREQEDFLRSEMFPAGGPTRRSALLVNAVNLVGQRLLSPDWCYAHGTFARTVASELA